MVIITIVLSGLCKYATIKMSILSYLVNWGIIALPS